MADPVRGGCWATRPMEERLRPAGLDWVAISSPQVGVQVRIEVAFQHANGHAPAKRGVLVRATSGQSKNESLDCCGVVTQQVCKRVTVKNGQGVLMLRQ